MDLYLLLICNLFSLKGGDINQNNGTNSNKVTIVIIKPKLEKQRGE